MDCDLCISTALGEPGLQGPDQGGEGNLLWFLNSVYSLLYPFNSSSLTPETLQISWVWTQRLDLDQVWRTSIPRSLSPDDWCSCSIFLWHLWKWINFMMYLNLVEGTSAQRKLPTSSLMSKKPALGRADLRFCLPLLFFDSQSYQWDYFHSSLIYKMSDPHCYYYYYYYYRTQKDFSDNLSSVASLFCRWGNWDSCVFSHHHGTSQLLYDSSRLGDVEVTNNP